MTCHLNDYDYGHAGCCGCERDLDLAAAPSSLNCREGKIGFYFYFCGECFSSLQARGLAACDEAVARVLRLGRAALPDHTGFAVTTSLALQAHGGDLVGAYEVGSKLPRIVHDAIVAGQADVAIVPPFDWEA